MAATRKRRFSRGSSKKRFPSRRRKTTMGRILPPVDIRKPNQMGELLKRISKGGITIVLVYADWCGHCHHFMPHFDSAAKSPRRSVQVAKINEKMVGPANSALKSLNGKGNSLEVQGYPSVMLVDRNAEVITPIEAVKDTKTMRDVMEKSGSLAAEMEEMENENPINQTMNMNMNANRSKPSSSRKPLGSMPTNSINSIETASLPIIARSPQNASNSFEAIGDEEMENENPVSPSNSSGDMIETNSAKETAIKGGSLYDAIRRKGGDLAAAGVLMGLAAATIRPRKGRRSHTRRFKRF